jgi:hypothetical protein
MSGKGVFDYLSSAGAKAYNSLPVVDTNLANLTDKAFDFLGFAQFDATSKKFLQDHGNENIFSLTARRAPIKEMINLAVNTITGGKWNESRQKFGYDKMFHLGLVINQVYIFEYLSHATIGPKSADEPGSEFWPVDGLGQGGRTFTIRSLLETTINAVGKDKFFKYDTFVNNCQDHIIDILASNNIGNSPGLRSWIKQPVEEVLAEMPSFTQSMANTITTGATLLGAGRPNGSESVPGLHKAFSEDDIRRLAGDVPVLRYPELASMTDTSQLFKGKVGAALLFLTEGGSDGHWIAVLDKPDHHEVFDSFGTAVDGDRAWLDKQKLMEFHETAPLLSILLRTSGKKVIHNTRKLQEDNADTCGRYVAGRIARADTPLHQFVADLISNGRSPDVNITEMTNNMKG